MNTSSRKTETHRLWDLEPSLRRYIAFRLARLPQVRRYTTTEDVLQTVFLITLQKVKARRRAKEPPPLWWKEPSRLRAYLLGVSQNVVNGLTRDPRVAVAVHCFTGPLDLHNGSLELVHFEAPTLPPPEILDREQDLARLEEKLGRLSPEDRTTLLLRASGATYEEISHLLRSSVQAVRRRKSRALVRLQRLWHGST